MSHQPYLVVNTSLKYIRTLLSWKVASVQSITLAQCKARQFLFAPSQLGPCHELNSGSRITEHGGTYITCCSDYLQPVIDIPASLPNFILTFFTMSMVIGIGSTLVVVFRTHHRSFHWLVAYNIDTFSHYLLSVAEDIGLVVNALKDHLVRFIDAWYTTRLDGHMMKKLVVWL